MPDKKEPNGIVAKFLLGPFRPQVRRGRPKFGLLKRLGFGVSVFRDTTFYVIIAMFPLSIIWLKESQVTWYVLSGYIYGLMISAIMRLVYGGSSNSAPGDITIQMIKIIILLSSFVMILFSENDSVVRVNEPGIAIMLVLFICLYHEMWTAKRGQDKE